MYRPLELTMFTHSRLFCVLIADDNSLQNIVRCMNLEHRSREMRLWQCSYFLMTNRSDIPFVISPSSFHTRTLALHSNKLCEPPTTEISNFPALCTQSNSKHPKWSATNKVRVSLHEVKPGLNIPPFIIKWRRFLERQAWYWSDMRANCEIASCHSKTGFIIPRR